MFWVVAINSFMYMVLNDKAAMVIDLLDGNCTDGACGNDYYPFKSKIHVFNWPSC